MTYEMTDREVEVEGIAHATADAYSFERYGCEKGWRECIEVLLEHATDRLQVEAFLRSKHMRWAADMEMRDGVDYGDFDGETLRAYIRQNPKVVSENVLLQLKWETFPA